MSYSIQKGIKNQVLRKKSLLVKDFSNQMKKFEKVLIEKMKKNNGIGLAAPQIGKNITVICCLLDNKKSMVFYNPQILQISEDLDIQQEGCLSLPGVWGKVPRAQEIVLEFQDVKGKKSVLNFSGLNARIIQHEIDHLQGVLFVDKLVGEMEVDKDVSLEELQIN